MTSYESDLRKPWQKATWVQLLAIALGVLPLMLARALVLSRILVYTGVASRIATEGGPLINWSFFLVVYTVVGLNREVFLSQPSSIIPAAAITVATTFFLGYVIERAGRILRIDPKRVISMVLLGTSKNAGFAAGLALTLLKW